MGKVWTDAFFRNIDMAKLCRNFRQNASGTDVAMANNAAALQVLAKAVNTANTRFPRPIFGMAMPITGNASTTADDTGADPLYYWQYYDSISRPREARLIVMPRTSGSGDAYAAQYEATSFDFATGFYNYTASDLNFCEGVCPAEYKLKRVSTLSFDERLDGVSTFNGYTIMDIVVQEEEQEQIDTAGGNYVDPNKAKTGNPVLADVLEQARSTFHPSRQYALPTMGVNWAAQGITGTPGTSDETAMVTTSSSFTNIALVTATSRNANTPGQYCPAYCAGVGVSENVKLECSVLCKAVTGTGTIRFEGPDHIANNYVDITITADTGPAWYGGFGHEIFLNSASSDDDTSTERNKVDVFHKVSSGTLYTYGLRARYVYGE